MNFFDTVDIDYKPQYRILNESYDSVKQGTVFHHGLISSSLTHKIEIYKEIYATMQKMQELDHKFNAVKATFHLTMEKNYEQMSNHLISQCDALTKEQADYKNKLKSGWSYQFRQYMRLLILKQMKQTENIYPKMRKFD